MCYRHSMKRLPPTAEGLAAAVDHLRGGGILGMPTETVYGLAASAFDARAVAAIFAAKERPLFDPLIAHVAEADPASAVAPLARLDALGEAACERFAALATCWPGPLTIVLPKRAEVPDLVTAGLPTVAVRMPDHPVAQALLRAFGGPLVAPSANRFGRISPTTVEAVEAELGDRVPFVLDGGPCAIGVESTVVAVDADGAVRLLRPGGVPREALEGLVGAIGLGGSGIEAPGQVESHYAPSKPLTLLPAALDVVTDGALEGPGAVALLRVVGSAEAGRQRLERAGIEVIEAASLSEVGDLSEAARALFATLRRLDEGPAARIVAEPGPGERGLGHAIADRLRRASARARAM